MVQRKRPLKLHIKDGKDARFLLIGHKGRELQDLTWDGHSLSLEAVSATAEASAEPNSTTEDEHSSGSESEQTKTDEPFDKSWTDAKDDEDIKFTEMDDADADAISSVSADAEDSPEATSAEPLTQDVVGGMTIEAETDTPDVTGEADIEDAKSVIDDALDPDLPSPEGEPSPDDDGPGLDKTSAAKDMLEIEETAFLEKDKDEDPPIKVDAGIPGNPKEPSGWLVRGKDKIAIIAEEDQTDDEAVKETQADHPGYKLHRGPKEPESDEPDKGTEE